MTDESCEDGPANCVRNFEGDPCCNVKSKVGCGNCSPQLFAADQPVLGFTGVTQSCHVTGVAEFGERLKEMTGVGSSVLEPGS